MSQLQKEQAGGPLKTEMIVPSQIKTETLIVGEVEGQGKDLISMPGSHNAFLGISLGKRFFSKEHTKMYFDWALSNCKDFMLIIDDWEEQHNYKVFKKLRGEESAKIRALSEGKNKKRAFTKVLNWYPVNQRAKVKIMCSSELFQNPEHAEILSIRDKLVSMFSQNPEFREAIIQSVETSIRGKIEAWKNEMKITEKDKQYHEALELLSRYRFEEIAVTIYLREQMGFPTEIYPESAMPVVRNLYEGKYPELTQEFISRNNYGYINLGMK